MKYRKLRWKLACKGYDVRAKEFDPFCSHTGSLGRYVGDILVPAKLKWPIAVLRGPGMNNAVYFSNIRQLQRWAENGFRDNDLPAIEYTDGYVQPQKKFINI